MRRKAKKDRGSQDKREKGLTPQHGEAAKPWWTVDGGAIGLAWSAVLRRPEVCLDVPFVAGGARCRVSLISKISDDE